MRIGRHRRLVALVLALALVLPAGWAVAETLGPRQPSVAAGRPTTPPVGAACGAAPSQVTAAIQRYVDRFAGLTGFEDRRLPAPPQAAEVHHEFAVVQRDLRRHHCREADFHRRLADQLAAVRARGPLARAVAGMLRTDALLVTGPGTGSAVRSLPAGADLAAAVAAAPPGATVRLQTGSYRLHHPLYVLQDVHIVGRGSGRTHVLSTAEGAAAVVPGAGELRLDGLTLRHVGNRPASVLAVWGGRVRVEGAHLADAVVDRRAGNQRVSARSRGGSGIMVSGDARVTVGRSVLSGNDVAGVLAGGSVRASLTAARLTGNGMCGICFVDHATGGVRDSRVVDNHGLGVAIYGDSTPQIVDNTVTGNRQADIVVAARGRSTVSGNSCGSTAGIVLVGPVTPTLAGNRCALHRQPVPQS